MDFIDLLIGLTLVHAIPHLILGVWKRKMFTPFGSGSAPNIIYSLTILGFSLTLFCIKYGISAITNNGIYVGAVLGIIIYLFLAPWMYKKMRSRRYN